MKIKTVLHRYLTVLALIYLSASIQTARSQAVTQTDKLTPFTGSDLKSENLVSKVDAIFVGRVMAVGGMTLSAPGEGDFSGSLIKVIQVLRGSVTVQEVTVAFKTVDDAHEETPTVGNSYIFFVVTVIHPDPDPYKAHKILPATEDNIAKVKALIAAAPTDK